MCFSFHPDPTPSPEQRPRTTLRCGLQQQLGVALGPLHLLRVQLRSRIDMLRELTALCYLSVRRSLINH